MLGLGLVPIDERSFTPRAGTSAEGGSASSHYMGKPPLVLKPLHGKSLSSLRTANSEALERLGTGNWDVVQRDATGSSRQTEGSNATLGSDMTDLGAGDGMRWRDVVGDRAPVESPGGMEGAYDHGAFWNERNARAATGPGSPVGPRPMPPSKDGFPDSPGAARGETLPLQGRGYTAGYDGDPRRTQALYGLVPKPTLYVANPGKKATDSSG
ncbi:hypothetical protein M408DRAFT_31133 [Serendipita vermifera MAFF 305830]|uniref:Uncharacterized protein n=1 Tax=Serendipita vermifera MAFF 305830 TaxID=933852 RepID=A0A0C3AHG8_SERVB|nr:hypothetical protein M408DRAFT_31133 [Serendipita vermifera MAFF 305830]